MPRLCLNNRDELRIIETDDILYVQASGNYTELHFANGQQRTILATLTTMQQLVDEAYAPLRQSPHQPRATAASPFLRLGRSILVNTDRVAAVSLPALTVTFNTTAPVPPSASYVPATATPATPSSPSSPSSSFLSSSFSPSFLRLPKPQLKLLKQHLATRYGLLADGHPIDDPDTD